MVTGGFGHSFTGITLTDVTPVITEANGIYHPRGIIVVDVLEDGPAADVLEPSELEVVDGVPVPVGGDVMVAMDATELVTAEALGSYPGLHTDSEEPVSITLLREGERVTVDLELGERSADTFG